MNLFKSLAAFFVKEDKPPLKPDNYFANSYEVEAKVRVRSNAAAKPQPKRYPPPISVPIAQRPIRQKYTRVDPPASASNDTTVYANRAYSYDDFGAASCAAIVAYSPSVESSSCSRSSADYSSSDSSSSSSSDSSSSSSND